MHTQQSQDIEYTNFVALIGELFKLDNDFLTECEDLYNEHIDLEPASTKHPYNYREMYTALFEEVEYAQKFFDLFVHRYPVTIAHIQQYCPTLDEEIFQNLSFSPPREKDFTAAYCAATAAITTLMLHPNGIVSDICTILSVPLPSADVTAGILTGAALCLWGREQFFNNR
jgi:hypothetical protein